MNEAGADARRLLEHLAARYPDLLRGPRVQALRQILVQNYHWDPPGACAGATMRATPACRRRPPASSRPTTWRPATPAAARSPAGPGTSPT